MTGSRPGEVDMTEELREWTVRTLQELVGIDSVNPSLVAGAAGESVIAGYVADVMGEIGLEVEVHEREIGRPSVVGTLRGGGGGRSLMLNAHVDTVGIEGMADPFSAEVRDGRLYGRGAYDMKGSLAACLACARRLAGSDEPLAGDLLVAAVADEEYASLGTAEIIEHHPVDGAIVTEPTGLDICIAHRGFSWIEVVTRGRAAHGSKYEEGIDANLRMGRFLTRLDGLERSLRKRIGHAILGPPSLHAATLEGGEGLSTYAALSRVQIERRTLPGETEDGVVAEIQDLLDELVAEDSEFEAELSVIFSRSPFEAGQGAPITRAVIAAVESVLGGPAELVGQSPWMDSALLADAGVETVVIGPDGTGAHADEEWVDLDTVEQFSRILVRAARQYCVA